MTVSPVVAKTWLERWDRQQERYIADREERFDVIADVVHSVITRPDAVIVDLGCGPGSLTARLADRFPHTTVIGVDADPLLLGLAQAGYAERHNVRFVQADLRGDAWTGALEPCDRVDAFVSTTALHWLTRAELGRVFDTMGTLLVPGGAFVDGDNVFRSSPRLRALEQSVRDGRAERVLRSGDGELWADWWQAVGADADLAELVGERGARPVEHHVADLPDLDDHVTMLRDRGFTEVGTVWQHGDDRVLVALK